VIGSGLAGLSCANMLARSGHSVLLLEHHRQLGGLAAWFKRKGGHIFDVSLHGFPVGMLKTCRKYWSQEIADMIVQLKGIVFDNPQFSFTTTFERQDFTRILQERFKVPAESIEGFFNEARDMNYYDDQSMTTRELFEKHFPGRDDVVRLLMEPITYANGSTLDDPAISYGIVFSNFMSKGVYTVQGGTDLFISRMRDELVKNGVDVRTRALVEKVTVEGGRVSGVVVNGQAIKCRAAVSNGNLVRTVHDLVGDEHFSPGFMSEARNVRLNNSSCQVQQLPGVHGHQAGREDRPHRRPAFHLDRREVRLRNAAQPRYHEPDLLHLLPGDTARLRHVLDRRLNKRELRGLGRSP